MNAIILLPAALCPIHKDHIKIIEIARKHLESKKYNVKHAYLLPSSEQYVNQKTEGHVFDSLEHRVNMCEIAVKDIDWISVLNWGMASGNKAKEKIEKDNPECKVFIVAGSDTNRNKKNKSLIVVHRDWRAPSSTQVRKAIKEKEYDLLKELVDENVYEYIIKIINY